MAAPYSFEPTIRIQDKAIYDWLGGFLVDYVIEDPETKRILVNQPQVPVIRTVSSPDRAFATVVDQLVSKGWIDGASDATKRAKAEYDWAVLPLPVVTIDRDEPTPSNLLQMPPTAFRSMFLDSQGRYIPVAAPLHYITVYRLTFWSNKRYTHSHFMEWILGQQGLPGAGPQEVYIPVQHEEPWGTILHALRYTESANLSSLEGDDPRYIRTQLAFTLRSWLFRALPDETRSVDSIYSIGADVASNIDGANLQESVPFQPSATLNLYSNPFPAYLVPTAWPKYGAATVEAAGSAPQSTIVATLTSGATDRIPVVQKLSTLGTDGRAYVSIGMAFRSIGEFAIELRQSAMDGTGETVVRRRVIPADPDDSWRKIHMFSSVTGAKFEWSIASAGVATVVTTGAVDARQTRDVTTRPPSGYTAGAGVVDYRWETSSNTPHIVYTYPYAGSGYVTAYSDRSKIIGRTASLEASNGDACGLLVMPTDGAITLTVPNTLGVSAVRAVPFDGAYLGDIDGFVSPKSIGVDRAAVDAAATKAAAFLATQVNTILSEFTVTRGGDFGHNRYGVMSPFADGAWPTLNEYRAKSQPSRATGLYELQVDCDLTSSNYAGVVFENGSAPSVSAGQSSSAFKANLSSARSLRIVARCLSGTVSVEVRLGLVGGAVPDSGVKSWSNITLTTTSQVFTLPISAGEAAYLTAIEGLFIFAVTRAANGTGTKSLIFEDITYEAGTGLAFFTRAFPASWACQTPSNDFSVTMYNVAFAYDLSLVAIALFMRGFKDEGKAVCDGLVWAIANDRFYSDGRCRNSYMSGPAHPIPGHNSGKSRLPGWWGRAGINDAGAPVDIGNLNDYNQDPYVVSTWVGTVAWVALALEVGAKVADIAPTFTATNYLSTVKGLLDYCITMKSNTGVGGYLGGHFGADGAQSVLTWKSTEHAADLAAAFTNLSETYTVGSPLYLLYQSEATHARQFVSGMWNTSPSTPFWWTGSKPDGVTIEEGNIPIDCTLWSIYGAGFDAPSYLSALPWMASNCTWGPTQDTPTSLRLAKYSVISDAGWIEGSGQFAAAYWHTDNPDSAYSILWACLPYQASSGEMQSSTASPNATGFELPQGGAPWVYYDTGHTGATGWFVIGHSGLNPFYWPSPVP